LAARIRSMVLRSARVFVTLFLFLLQMLGPFLHAHAHGQAGPEGLHVHMQTGVVDDPGPTLKLDPGVDHWVMGMPQAHKPDTDIALKNIGEPQQPALVSNQTKFLAAVSASAFRAGYPQAPPGAFPDYTWPLTLAPPLA
jgi:hypothetical protein